MRVLSQTESKVGDLVNKAERDHLYGEILLRFRNGRLIMVVTTTTTPMGEELRDDSTR